MRGAWVVGVTIASLGLGVVAGWAARRLVDNPPAGTATTIIVSQVTLTLWALAVSATMATAIASAILAAALLTLAATDLASLRLPDLVTLPLIAAGLIVAGLEATGIWDHVLGALGGWTWLAALAAGFRRLTGRRGIGMGDAKLLAAAGAWCGWRALPSIVLIACAAALVWAAWRLLREGRASAGQPLPFGLPLAFALWLVRLHGAWL